MNYARVSAHPFVTQKSIATKKAMSAETKSRREFIEAHTFSVSVNSSTKEVKVNVTKKEQ